MSSSCPTILLVDPIRMAREYDEACRELGFASVSLFTGLASPMPDAAEMVGDVVLHANGIDDAIAQVRAHVPDLHAVVPVTEAGITVADAIAAEWKLPANDHALSWARRNKAAMRARAVEAGLRVPEFRVVRSIEDLPAAAAEIGFPAIAKQTMGWGSYGVMLLDDAAAAEEASAAVARDVLDRPMSEWLVERYVRGTEYAVNFYSADSDHRLVDIWEYRRPDDRDYDFPLWDIVQIDPLHPAYEPVEKFARSVLAAFGVLCGPSHMEVKVQDGEVYLIEIAARLSGGPAAQLWERHSNLRPLSQAVECYLGRRPSVIDDDHGFRAVLGSVVFCNLDRPGRLIAVHGLDELRALPGVADVLVTFEPGDHVPVTNHNMCIPVSASIHGPDTETVLRTIAAARSTITLEIGDVADLRDAESGEHLQE